jgi:hypothetical protein
VRIPAGKKPAGSPACADSRRGIAILQRLRTIKREDTQERGHRAEVGERVKKGKELGYFSYGGSSLSLVFQRGAIDRFTVPPNT